MATRLPDPPLIPSSMSAGGEWHSNDLAMTAPGSQPVTALPMGLDETLPLPVNSGPQIPVSTEQDRTRGNDGKFQTDGPWKQAGSDAGGWVQC